MLRKFYIDRHNQRTKCVWNVYTAEEHLWFFACCTWLLSLLFSLTTQESKPDWVLSQLLELALVSLQSTCSDDRNSVGIGCLSVTETRTRNAEQDSSSNRNKWHSLVLNSSVSSNTFQVGFFFPGYCLAVTCAMNGNFQFEWESVKSLMRSQWSIFVLVCLWCIVACLRWSDQCHQDRMRWKYLRPMGYRWMSIESKSQPCAKLDSLSWLCKQIAET